MADDTTASDCTMACVMGHTNEPGCLYNTTPDVTVPAPFTDAEFDAYVTGRAGRSRYGIAHDEATVERLVATVQKMRKERQQLAAEAVQGGVAESLRKAAVKRIESLSKALETEKRFADHDRAELAAETAVAKELLQRNVELGTRLDAAEAKREDAEAALETLRRQIGETPGVEWSFQLRGDDGKPMYTDRPTKTREAAAKEAAYYDDSYVVSRLVGEWRETEEGGEAT